jgi:class 3 adenylate cyclase
VAIFSLVGFECATAFGEEAKDPLETIPRAVIWSLIISGVFFVVITYAMIIGTRGYSSPLDRIDAPLNVMAEMAHVGLLQIPLSLGAMVSFFALCLSCQRVSELGKRWQKFGYELDFGIGISLGFATLGKIGFEGQFNYGAVGTVTNLAARLCAEARGGQILISQRVYAIVEELIEAEPVEEELLLKGFHKPVMAFDVLRLKQPEH